MKNGILENIWYVASGNYLVDKIAKYYEAKEQAELPSEEETRKALLDHLIRRSFDWAPDNKNDEEELKEAFEYMLNSEYMRHSVGFLNVTSQDLLDHFKGLPDEEQNSLLPKKMDEETRKIVEASDRYRETGQATLLPS